MVKPEEAVRAFRKAGWVVKRHTGGHVIMEKEGMEVVLSIPYHKGKDVKRGTLRSLIKDAGLTEEEFINFL